MPWRDWCKDNEYSQTKPEHGRQGQSSGKRHCESVNLLTSFHYTDIDLRSSIVLVDTYHQASWIIRIVSYSLLQCMRRPRSCCPAQITADSSAVTIFLARIRRRWSDVMEPLFWSSSWCLKQGWHRLGLWQGKYRLLSFEATQYECFNYCVFYHPLL